MIYHKRTVNFTGWYQAPYVFVVKVSVKQAMFCMVLGMFQDVFGYYAKVKIQAPLKLIPKFLLTSLEASFLPKNPYIHACSLELCFNSNVFHMGVEIERKRKGNKGV